MFNTIKALVPNAERGDFRLRDDGDGIYFESWNTAKLGPEPDITGLVQSSIDGGSREPTQAELMNLGETGLEYLNKRLTKHVDDEIASRRYMSRDSIAVYASTPGRLRQEARGLIAWRVDVYGIAEDLEDAVLAGDPVPTWPELLAQLPTPPARRRPPRP